VFRVILTVNSIKRLASVAETSNVSGEVRTGSYYIVQLDGVLAGYKSVCIQKVLRLILTIKW
jgi:hypothetical protein